MSRTNVPITLTEAVKDVDAQSPPFPVLLAMKDVVTEFLRTWGAQSDGVRLAEIKPKLDAKIALTGADVPLMDILGLLEQLSVLSRFLDNGEDYIVLDKRNKPIVKLMNQVRDAHRANSAKNEQPEE